jgi:hypothetical protein
MKTTYTASERDIIATIDDFMVFCHFMDERKPIMSKRKGMMGKSDLFELNSLLNYGRKDITAPNYLQESYHVIDLIFNLALLGKLYVKTGDSKGNVYLKSTARKDEFDRLNNFEKYAFLFETFWTIYDIEEILTPGWNKDAIDGAVIGIAKSHSQEKLRKGSFSERVDHDPVFSFLSTIIYYLNYFGLCSYIPIIDENKKLTRYDDSIEAVVPTEFGVELCKTLTDHKIVEWNIPWLKELGFEEKEIIPGITVMPYYSDKKEQRKAEKLFEERREAGFIPLHKFMEPAFPPGVLNHTVTAGLTKVPEGSYVFKVSLGARLWRKIRLSFKHTLEDLHLAIQKAFDFDNDHLYSFFMDGNKRSKHAYNSPWSSYEPFTNEGVIGDLELYEGQKILYLFDYGDEWEFDVRLLKINTDEPQPKEPEIIETKGDAPQQYRFWDDDL